MAEVLSLNEQVRLTAEASKAFHAVLAYIEDLMADCLSLTAGTKQAKAVCDILTTSTRELDVYATTSM